MPERPKKKLVFKGKNIYYKTIVDLSKKLKLSKDETRGLLRDYSQGETTRYLIKNNQTVRYDLREKPPALIRDFDIKSFRNKKFISKNSTIKNVKVLNTLRGERIGGKIYIRFRLSYAGTYQGDRNITILVNHIEREYTDTELINLISTQPDWTFLENSDFNFTLISKEYKTVLDQNLSWGDYGLQNETVNLCNIFNELIPNNEGHCIKDYLKKTYKKIGKKTIDKLETIDNIYDFCVKYKIKLVVYDINCNLIKENREYTNTYKALCFIAYNNHLYPLKNETIKKIPEPLKYELNLVVDCHKEFMDLIKEEGELGSHPNVYNDRITSFFHDGFLYFENKDFEKCETILDKFGIGDKMTPYTTLNNINEIIQKLYVKESVSSFFPECHKISKGAFTYGNKKLINKNPIQIDKNKAYSSILKNLDYLMITDIKTMKHGKPTKKINIQDHYLYIVEPEKSSILLNDTQICIGKKLKLCDKHNIKYKVKEVLECTYKTNYYKKMVEDLYEMCDNDSFKQIVNIMIGKFSQEKTFNRKQKYIKICNEDELNRNINKEGIFHTQIDDDTYILYEFQEKIGDIFNKHPINIQIKDEMDMLLFKTMNDLGLKDQDIVKINTDCIAFINKDDKYKELIGDGLDDWKIETFKKDSIINNEVVLHTGLCLEFDSFNNTLGCCYAGTGKSYYLINDLIPKLKDKSYIVVSPSHSSIKEYREKKINCNVIQYYIYHNLPKEDIIIVDEIGMLDYQNFNMLYKLSLMGKIIIGMGDFNQLAPVNGGYCSSPLFIDMLFRYKVNLDINRRNNLSIEYYDSLIKSKNHKYLTDEIQKHSVNDYKKADHIICYENKTRQKYNELMKTHHKINNLWDKGCKIICKTNDLRSDNIYNNFTYTVIKTEGEKVYLTNDIIIDKADLINFDYNYAGTAYSVQGKSLNSFHYAKEDFKWLNNNTTYTIISRIKQKVETKPNYDFKIIV